MPLFARHRRTASSCAALATNPDRARFVLIEEVEELAELAEPPHAPSPTQMINRIAETTTALV
jgi:hypothetical protein